MSQFIAAIEACMDDDISMDPKALWVGTPGSFVTLDGDSEKYPKAARALVEKYRPLIHKALRAITEEMGVELVSTSHTGCGAMGIQGVTQSSEVASVTEKFAKDNPDIPKYVGHVSSSPDNVLNLGANASAHVFIDRKEDSHEHSAYGLVFTTGGFISGEEMARLELGTLEHVHELQEANEVVKSEPSLHKYFVVTVDAMKRVVSQEGGSKEEIVAILSFIKNLAETIIQGTLEHKHHGEKVELPKLRVVTFDAQRLPNDSQENEAIAQEVMKS